MIEVASKFMDSSMIKKFKRLVNFGLSGQQCWHNVQIFLFGMYFIDAVLRFLNDGKLKGLIQIESLGIDIKL